MDADQDDSELRNPFPSPPSHYSKYTTINLNLLTLLKERTNDLSETNQAEILKDQPDVPDWPLSQLEKPRIDWILDEEDAHFSVFGDTWLVKEKVLSLGEHGVTQLYPSDPSTDRRPALVSILRSLLLTYSSLTSSLLAPPPLMTTEEPPDWYRNIEWLGTLGQNLMAAANELRPIQARGNLEAMLKRQLDHRRQETAELHRRCDEWETKLADLRRSATDFACSNEPSASVRMDVDPSRPQVNEGSRETVSTTEVLQWAEELG